MKREQEISTQPTASVLVADDEQLVREFVIDALRHEGFEVTGYNPLLPDTAKLQRTYDIIILDIVMPGMNGFELRRKLLNCNTAAQFIMTTAYPDKCTLHETLETGAFTFLVKPFTVNQLLYAVLGAWHKKQSMAQVPCREMIEHDLGLVGHSTHLETVRQRILELAPLEVPIFVSGESGTGKEVVARSIHANSPRKQKPFIAVNCGGFTQSLIESELFGFVPGAFTGASKTKHGFFEAADGGTIFLDEIGELPLELQSRFLRVLDTGEYIRIGENKARKTNVRVISATNRDLWQMVREGAFRKDLYFRLRGGRISLLPLRDRFEDIPPLVQHLLGNDYFITSGAMEELQSYDWPGNVRELSMVLTTLKNTHGGAITRASIRKSLAIFDDKPDNSAVESYRQAKKRLMEGFEKEYFADLLQKSGRNLSKAATIAGIDRKTLREKLKSLDMHNQKNDSPDA